MNVKSTCVRENSDGSVGRESAAPMPVCHMRFIIKKKSRDHVTMSENGQILLDEPS
jgi:hypothetical protein